MDDRTGPGRPREDAPASRGRTRTEDDARDTSGKAVFNPKGIGSNAFLTAAAAVVPLVIVGVASVKTLLDVKRGKR